MRPYPLLLSASFLILVTAAIAITAIVSNYSGKVSLSAGSAGIQLQVEKVSRP